MPTPAIGDGFEVSMDCPNDRYVNDEAICLAVVSMLAKIGVKVNLLAQPKALYFKKVLAPSLDTSFYLLGWTPGSFDSWNPLFNLHGCYNAETGNGKFNLGRYCNPKVDELSAKILSETDAAKRTAMITDAWKMTTRRRGLHPAAPAGAGVGCAGRWYQREAACGQSVRMASRHCRLMVS